ncbi:MAG TPA: thiol-disulfide isomerase [Candidatus Angelobacter sp.]
MKGQLLKGLLIIVGVSLCSLLMGIAATSDTAPPPPGKITFYKDVLPILQNNCQSCHRPGEVAPMSLMTYEEARPWAVAIKMAVVTRKMPPWYADPQYGHFSNERMLTAQQTRTLVSWVDGGAQPGDPKDGPPPMHFTDGWNIGTPDRVIEMPLAFNVPPEGTIDYQYMVIPGGFKEDTWVRAAEVRPGNRAVVHHVIAFIRSPESKWMRDAKPNEFFVPKKTETQDDSANKNSDNKDSDKKTAENKSADNKTAENKNDSKNGGQESSGEPRRGERRRGDIGELLVGYAPGLQALDLNGEARLIKAGSDIVLQLHYTANGTAGSDKSKIGLIFAKEPPRLRNITLSAGNAGFKIPPNDPNYEVKSQVRLEKTVTLSNLMPHMHFRGKDFLYQVIYPDGRTETLLSVPKYDFNWQLGYELAKPIVLPKGTRIECTAHFDNSINNPYNPDPNKEVKWGDQTWEEMMIGFFSVSVDPTVSTAGILKSEKPGTRTPPGEADTKASDAASGGSRSSSTQ